MNYFLGANVPNDVSNVVRHDYDTAKERKSDESSTREFFTVSSRQLSNS